MCARAKWLLEVHSLYTSILVIERSLHANSDGWVPNDVWDAAKDAHRAVYEEWIQTSREAESRGEGLTVAKADKLWPFDAR